MTRRSVISRLDESTRHTVDSMIRDGATIAEVHARLLELVGDNAPALSTVGAYLKRQRSQLQRYRAAQELAKVWIGRLSDVPDGDVGRLLAEMLRSIAFGALVDLGEPQAGDADARTVALLARAIRDLAAADRTSAARELEIRREAVHETVHRAADAVAEAGRARDLDDATVQAIRSRVLGVSRANGSGSSNR